MKRGRLKRRYYRWIRKKLHNWEAICGFLQARSGGRCERCKRVFRNGVQPQNAHHVKPRSQGGTDDPSNLAALCGPKEFFGEVDRSCHTWVEENKKQARKEGWLK